MRAAVFHGPGNITVDDVPHPLVIDPTDAIVEVEAAGVCGSDLWTYRDQSTAAPGARIGHEFVGRIHAIGSDVASLAIGDWVIAPFRYSDGVCRYCQRGLTSSCINGGFWSREVVDGGQGEYVRVPFADTTLVKPTSSGDRPDSHLIDSLLALTDVMATGYHAAASAKVLPGDTVCVVGDGAVAACAVLAAHLLGAARIIVLGSDHGTRRDLMETLPVDDLFAVRGEEATEAVLQCTDGNGVDAVMECVGTSQSFSTALSIAAPGSSIGYVGLPHGVLLDPATMFAKNLQVAGGMAPARSIIELLLPKVLDGTLRPGVVFTSRYSLSEIPQAYADLDNRRCVKPMITVAKES